MSEKKVVRFDDAWARANKIVGSHPSLSSGNVVLIRDLLGKIRIALNDREGNVIPSPEEQAVLADALDSELGRFSPGRESLFMLASKMFAPDEVFNSPDVMWADPSHQSYRILDRYIIGSDWLRPPFDKSAAPVITFYGVKGGVGRSTAMAVLAWRLSQSGRRVLILDLDLESPGIGSTLLPDSQASDFGIVDWLVEDAIGQADEALIREMAASSSLGRGGAELIVAPAGGRIRESYSYLPKLARSYAEVVIDDRAETFGDRLHRLVGQLEAYHRPDVILLDSRAGLHDIAAISVTRMNATSLLFAVNAEQTWHAYKTLFQEWHAHFDRVEKFRESLKIVAAQIPETETLSYLESFQQKAYDLFSENLYVETPAGEESEFNFDLNDPEAPHFPLRINWSRSFQQFDPIRQPGAITEEQIAAAYGDFVKGVSLLAFGEVVL